MGGVEGKNGVDDRGTWTAKMVADRLEEAARILRRLRVTGLKPSGYGNTWPEIVYHELEISDWCDVEVRLGPPNPEEVTRMDEALEWLRLLEKDQVHLVWMHAEGVPRKKIYATLGLSKNQAWKMWNKSLEIIAVSLNVRQKRILGTMSMQEKFALEYQRTGNASAAYRVVFPCGGLSNDVIHDRSRRLARKINTAGNFSDKSSHTGENRRKLTIKTGENRRILPKAISTNV
ncbi:MAG: hypothetical protein HQL90_11315 [Magnetococcales bacterium]|nr:hypothetical protein [Magnetococcales bacterium]